MKFVVVLILLCFAKFSQAYVMCSGTVSSMGIDHFDRISLTSRPGSTSLGVMVYEGKIGKYSFEVTFDTAANKSRLQILCREPLIVISGEGPSVVGSQESINALIDKQFITLKCNLPPTI